MEAFLLTFASVWIGLSDVAGIHQSDSQDMYGLVLTTTSDLYPATLKEYFVQNQNQLQSLSTSPQNPASNDSKGTFSPADHYLKLDITAKGGNAAARSAAARSFPGNHKAAKDVFEKHGEKDGGNLPWVIDEHARKLQTAFESGSRESVNAHWAAIIHFATDAAMPFNSTFDLKGEILQEPKWCSPGAASAEHICSLRERFQRTLFTRNLNRLSYEVRVAPDRANQIDDTVQAVFDVLLDSHDAMLRVVEADRKIIAELRIHDLDHFHAAADAYYAHLVDQCGPLLEERIESASLLTANLVRSAWIRAGRPNIVEKFLEPIGKTTAEADTTKPGGKQPEPSATPEKPFGGSVNSTIFHRVGCNHLSRVKPENVVYFATIEEAQTAGRTPCKTCKP